MKTYNRFTHWFQKPLTILGLLLILIGITFPGWFGGFISGSIFNTQYQEIKPDYRFFWSNDNGQRYIYTLNVLIKGTTKRSFSVYPNDCISSVTINGKDYKELTGDLCNYREGVRLDAHDYLIKGVNTFTFVIDQTGNSKALTVKPSIDDPIRLITLIILGGGLVLLLFQIFKGWFIFSSIQKKRLFRVIVGIMYLLGRLYIRRSEYFQRSHDLTGHLDYFKLLLRGERVPKSDDCRQCYHPTTYYWINEWIYKIGGGIGWTDPYELIRRLTSVVRWIGIMFGFRTLYSLFYARNQHRRSFLLASCLFAFRPTQFYYGPRITNDVWHYALSRITIYYGLQARFAYQDHQDQRLVSMTRKGALASTIGLFVKSNSIVWLPLGVVGLIFAAIKKRRLQGFRTMRSAYYRIIILLKILVIGSVGVILRRSNYKGMNGIVDNADRLNEGNSVAYVPASEAFSRFPIREFIDYTTMRDEEDDAERRSFWGFLSKTMITGEMGVTHTKNLVFFSYFMIISLIAILHFLVRFLTSNPLKKDYNWYMLIGFTLPLIAMVCYRILYPLAASMHYRYILPHLIFVIWYSVYWITSTKEDNQNQHHKTLLRSVFDIIMIINMVLFIIASIVFSFPPYF